MKCSKIGLSVLVAATALFVTGCDDWEFGGSADQTSNKHDVVNFTGLYRAEDGGVLVTDFTVTSDEPPDPVSVSNVQIGSTNGVATVFQGTLPHQGIIPSTVIISLPGFVLTDDGSGSLTGTAGSSGVIQYPNGGWTVDTGGIAPAPGQIRASYQHEGSAAQQGPGATGRRIISFNVRQDGNNLRFTDNNGSVYEGTLGNIQFTGTPQNWTQAFVQFTVRGTNNASGLHITITGTLQAERTTANGQSVARRFIFANWLERGGRVGEIRGRAQDVGITTGS